MGHRGIRFTVTVLATGAVTLALLGASAWLVIAQRNTLTMGLDTTLERRASDVAAMLSSTESLPGSLVEADIESFVQVVADDGAVLLSTANVAGDDALVSVGGAVPQHITVQGLPVDDDRFRVHTRPVAGVGTIIVGTTFDIVDEATSALVKSLLVAVPALVAALAAITWWLVGQTLRPVESIRKQVAAIDSNDLCRRVPVAGNDDEISRLAGTMNDMLGRIEESIVRQRRFVDDASHELRSPLARMRTTIDVDLGDAEPESPIGSLRDDVVEMQRLVDDLLFLARADREQAATHKQPVDLDDIVLSEAEYLLTRANVTVDLSGVSGAHVIGDVSGLRRVIRNLLDNAERYASSTVVISLEQTSGTARVVIADDGPGVPAAEVESIFDRFARSDESRASDTGGTGLGLAIASEVAARHDGSLRLDNPGRPGARFVLELPAAD